jgi:hypothetical protein
MKRIALRGRACGRLLGVALPASLLPAAPAGVLAQRLRAAPPTGLPPGWASYLGGFQATGAAAEGHRCAHEILIGGCAA